MADGGSVEGLLLDTIPKELIPLIALALFLALTIFFILDRRRKLLNGKAKYDIFVNTCIFTVGLTTLYLFVLYVVGILFPSASIKQIYDTLVYFLWVIILGYIVIYFKAIGNEINKQELFSFLVGGLDFIFMFGTGLIIFYIISPVIRSYFRVLPTYDYVYSNLVIFIPMLFPLILYFITRTFFIPKIAQRYHVSLLPFIEPNSVFVRHWKISLFVLVFLAIFCFLFANWQINSAYTRNIVSQTATYGGYLTIPYNQSNITITTKYKINLTYGGVSTDIPLEFVNVGEKPEGDAVHTFGTPANLFWTNKSQFKENELEITTNRYVPVSPYFTYIPLTTYRNDSAVVNFLSFNFTGLTFRSTGLFLASIEDCSNLSVSTSNSFARINYVRPKMIDIVTGGRYPDQNDYSVHYENESKQVWFSFNIVRSEKIDFNITCLTSYQ